MIKFWKDAQTYPHSMIDSKHYLLIPLLQLLSVILEMYNSFNLAEIIEGIQSCYLWFTCIQENEQDPFRNLKLNQFYLVNRSPHPIFTDHSWSYFLSLSKHWSFSKKIINALSIRQMLGKTEGTMKVISDERNCI